VNNKKNRHTTDPDCAAVAADADPSLLRRVERRGLDDADAAMFSYTGLTHNTTHS